MKCFISLATKLFKCERGAISIMAAVVIPVLILGLAVGLNTANSYLAKSKAQQATDAALLGAVADAPLSSIQPVFEDLVKTNFQTSGASAITTIYPVVGTGDTFTASVDVTVPTFFGKFFGGALAGPRTLNVASEVTLGKSSVDNPVVEIALVLDNTGSMDQRIGGVKKIDSLKLAANDLIDILFGARTTLTNAHFSLIPYDSVVNVGPHVADWLQDEPQGPFGANLLPTAQGYFWVENTITSRDRYEEITTKKKGKGFAGNRVMDGSCGPYIKARDNGSYEATQCFCDEPGDVEECDGETGVCVMVPGCLVEMRCEVTGIVTRPTEYWWNYYNCFPKKDVRTDDSDLLEDPPTSQETRFRIPYETLDANDNVSIYPMYPAEADRKMGQPGDNLNWHDGDEWLKDLAPLLFASNDKAEIKQRIGDMKVSGKTRIPVGLMWGGFALSPKWRDYWNQWSGNPQPNPTLPRDYQPGLTKILILMTDGINYLQDDWNCYKCGPTFTERDDIKTAKLCEEIKQRGKKEGSNIVIYTIGFGDKNDLNQNMLKTCASSTTGHYFFAPTGADLRKAFREIAEDIAGRPVSVTRITR